MKKSLYAIAWMSLLAINNVNAAITTGTEKVDGSLSSNGTLENTVQAWVWNLLGFIALIAVLYWLWGWFNILTAGWDDDKVSKWKTVIINSLIWIVVIFLVNLVVQFLITTILA